MPTRKISIVFVRLASLFNPKFKTVLPDLGFARQVLATKAERDARLGGAAPEESIVAAGESLVAEGLVG